MQMDEFGHLNHNIASEANALYTGESRAATWFAYNQRILVVLGGRGSKVLDRKHF